MDRILIDTDTLAWENGLDVVRGMAAEFRDNLGPRDLVEALFALYEQKTLFLDPVTTRRLDLVKVLPGYRDLTNAFHDSVEECLVLEGRVWLDGEGELCAGDYFWRPPGFVHAASTEEGFTALLSFQGEDPAEDSGPVSRRIRADELAGTNQLHDDPERALGPRGWVRRQPTGLLPWLPGPTWSALRAQQLPNWDLTRTEARVLSQNEHHGGQSLLLRLHPGWSAEPSALGASRDVFVLEGHLERDGIRWGTGSFLHIPAGVEEPAWTSPAGATLYLRSDGWMLPGSAG